MRKWGRGVGGGQNLTKVCYLHSTYHTFYIPYINLCEKPCTEILLKSIKDYNVYTFRFKLYTSSVINSLTHETLRFQNVNVNFPISFVYDAILTICVHIIFTWLLSLGGSEYRCTETQNLFFSLSAECYCTSVGLFQPSPFLKYE